MRGSYGKWNFFVKFAFLLLARESGEDKGGGVRGRELTCVATDTGRRIGGRLGWFIYIPVFYR